MVACSIEPPICKDGYKSLVKENILKMSLRKSWAIWSES